MGRHGAFFATSEAVNLITTDQDAFVMLAFLRASNKPDAIFPVANGLSNKFGWRRQRVTAARNRLIAAGYIKRVRNAYTGHVAQYVWVRDKARLGGGRC